MVELKSYAKINLGLEIINKREDGYHNLRTIFQTIDLWDKIQIRRTREPGLNVEGSDPSVEWNCNTNTVKKAFTKIMGNYPLDGGFEVFVEKNIPSGAGLGGGSGNAAVVLLHLNENFNLGISDEEMVEIANDIGADVPFFLYGGTVLAEGVGEKISPLKDWGERKIALITPEITVNTGSVFSMFSLTKSQLESKISIFCESGLISQLRNDLEKTTFQMFPDIAGVKKRLEEHKCELVLMSGSGSSIFAVIGDSNIDDLKSSFDNIRIVRTVGREEYKASIGASPSGKASVFGADTAEVRILPPQRKIDK